MKINKTHLPLLSALFVALAFFPSNRMLAQGMEITDATTPPITPENLITNIFLGDGVEVIDVTFDGDPLAVGYFKNAEPVVGIERGILLTSGRAASVNCNGGPLGADCGGTQFSSNDANSSAGDPDLASIATGGLFDVAKFTITFVPTSDTLRFKYVFASEEYPEWACTSFNDVFGFFISGPGITGPFQNNGKNIALIPGTTTPVTINNIHPANGGGCPPAFAQFYNDNTTNSGQPVYDGYLSVFVAEAIVIPCETYTIKLAVSDVGDSAFDTGVFLEAKSFGTGSLQVETVTASLDGTITEGCATGTISFTFPGPVESDFPLDYTIIGTAENGVDYLPIPLDLFIPQGDSTLTVDIVALEDNLPEGMETIGIDIQRDVCNRDTFWIFVRDNEIVPPNLGPDTTICDGDTLVLTGELPIPLPVPPSFTNTQDYTVTHTEPINTPTYSPIQVAGVQPVILGEGVIRSVCVNILHKWVDDLDLFLITPGGQFMELSSHNGSNCDNYNNVCFTPTATNNIGDGYPWTPCPANIEAAFSNGTYHPEGVWSDLWDGEYPTNGTWQLLAIDRATGFNGTITDWTITFEPLYQVYYEWTPATGLSCADCPNPIATPSQNTTYHLRAWDTYGCEVYDTITVNVLDVLPAPNVTCGDITNNSITFNWDNIPGASGYMVNVGGTGWVVPNNGTTSHLVDGLGFNDTVTIEVYGVAECTGKIGIATCFTPECPAPSLSIIDQTNPSCTGDTNGSVTVQATGGAGDYTYTLGGVSNTTGVFTGLGEGTYPITVIDSWVCPNTINAVISVPNPLLAQALVLNEISCNGEADAAATATVSGGIYPYSYAWDNLPADSVASNLGPGTHTLLITDANGCTATASFDFDEPALLAVTAATDSVDCFGTNTGEALVLIFGGTPNFDIQWDAAAGNATEELVTDLPAGNYAVTVTDQNGCTATTVATVPTPAAISTSLTATDPLCNGGSDGTATVVAGGGTGNYFYFWSNGDGSPTADSLAATVHYITVSDANNCTAVDSIVLDEPAGIDITLTPQAVSCFGEADGAVLCQYIGGISPYSFAWNNGSTSQNINGVSAGNQCITITDGQGCATVACAMVTQPTAVELSAVSQMPDCNTGTNGGIDLTVAGGTSPYSYTWSNGLGNGEDPTGVGAGTYSVTVEDANGCSAQLSETVDEPAALSVQLSPTDVLCFGQGTGSISSLATGGTGGYSYTWSGPPGFSSSQPNLTGLNAGQYTLVLEDANGCQAQATATVAQPLSALQVSIAMPGEICFGANNGSANAAANGGSAPYDFVWNNGQQTPNAAGLTAGNYTVTATDDNGCTASAQVAIVQQEVINVQLSQSPPDCHDGINGSASVTSVMQGNASIPFVSLDFNWSNNQDTPVNSGLTGGGTYAVTVTNSLGCTGSASIQVDNPAEVTANITAFENVKCFDGRDGSATVSPAGGFTPFTFLWGVNAENQVTATASNLPAGIFTVTVTDANGCTATTSATLSEPPALDVRFEIENVKCFGDSDGRVLASTEGGVLPYLYQWSNGVQSNLLDKVAEGIYALTVTDANGCSVEMEAEVDQPGEPLAATYSVEAVSCFGFKDGTIDVEAGGGSPPYRYSLDGTNFYGNPTQIALASDVYNVVVKDNQGCLFTLENIFVGQPDSLSVDLGRDTSVWYGTDVYITPTLEGEDPFDVFTYDWSSNNPQVPPKDASSEVGGFKMTSPTTVRLTIENQDGCTAEDLVNIFVLEFRDLQVPTGFAPGSGGNPLNDLLHVHGSTLMVKQIKSFQIFDRWGELLFVASNFPINDTSVGWDGTFNGQEMPAGVYTWFVEVDFVDETSESYKGHTTLIR